MKEGQKYFVDGYAYAPQVINSIFSDKLKQLRRLLGLERQITATVESPAGNTICNFYDTERNEHIQISYGALKWFQRCLSTELELYQEGVMSVPTKTPSSTDYNNADFREYRTRQIQGFRRNNTFDGNTSAMDTLSEKEKAALTNFAKEYFLKEAAHLGKPTLDRARRILNASTQETPDDVSFFERGTDQV